MAAGIESLNESVTIHNITEVIAGKVSDLLYISEKVHMPEKKNIKRCYWTDFRLLPNKEAKKVCEEKKGITIDKEFEDHEFFVYNENKNTLLPFKKNDYLMNEKEYMTYDGEKYLYFDNDGNLKDYMRVEGDICSHYIYDKNNKEEVVWYKETLNETKKEEDAIS